MKLNFTIDLGELEGDSAGQEIIEAIRVIYKLLLNVSPNYYVLGNMLKEQLEKQVKEQVTEQKMSEEDRMRDKFWCLYDDIVHYKFYTFAEPLKAAIDRFVKSVGEAMGPICYNAYLVKQIAEAGLTEDCNKEIIKWLDECLKYYEENYSGVN